AIMGKDGKDDVLRLGIPHEKRRNKLLEVSFETETSDVKIQLQCSRIFLWIKHGLRRRILVKIHGFFEGG
ncbi:MAG: hypothetical protein Q8J68_06825, partial [Methanolobus sp.]|uniref:hypothetical protein n=1 Tax=Methanolobus sp. TaxID=1874737 RepID=UPI0027314DCC